MNMGISLEKNPIDETITIKTSNLFEDHYYKAHDLIEAKITLTHFFKGHRHHLKKCPICRKDVG